MKSNNVYLSQSPIKFGLFLMIIFAPSNVYCAAHLEEKEEVEGSINTRLFEAIQSGDKDKVEKLIREGINLDLPDNFGTSALVNAVLTGSYDIVKLLIDNGANTKGKVGFDALRFAIINRDKEIVQLLLSKNKDGMPFVDVNLKNEIGRTPLMIAAVSGTPEIVALLLEANADVSKKDKRGNSALKLARSEGNKEIVKLLKDELERRSVLSN